VGLAIETGVLADLLKHDQDGVKWLSDSLDKVNEVLKENNIPQHIEPTEISVLKRRNSIYSFPYSYIHYLRRVYARALSDPAWEVAHAGDEDPADDPFVEEESMMFSSHLLCHSDAEGFYLPIDFQEVLMDETDQDRILGGLLGSSHRLFEELVTIAPQLGISLDGDQLSDSEADKIFNDICSEGKLHIEKNVWLSLFESARISIQNKTAICFC
jgi:hypothetical protein